MYKWGLCRTPAADTKRSHKMSHLADCPPGVMPTDTTRAQARREMEEVRAGPVGGPRGQPGGSPQRSPTSGSDLSVWNPHTVRRSLTSLGRDQRLGGTPDPLRPEACPSFPEVSLYVWPSLGTQAQPQARSWSPRSPLSGLSASPASLSPPFLSPSPGTG